MEDMMNEVYSEVNGVILFEGGGTSYCACNMGDKGFFLL